MLTTMSCFFLLCLKHTFMHEQKIVMRIVETVAAI